ncbi:MAG: 2OG-Fe(II) oxygenase [Myxococcales bacterium]|nr:MAG: 2OG-Fe(II) oxygenase [Myxococcales bacterium]
MFAGHLDLTQPLLWTLDDALTPAECEGHIERLRGGAPEVAPIVGGRGVEIDLTVRNNTRVMWDDPVTARALLACVAARLPPRLSGQHLIGANPRLRVYRYGPGERHGAHWDTVVPFVGGAQSLCTLVFYLNEGFEGGETEFPELGRTVTPRRGSALVFQHRVLHIASEVLRGEKFVLRTDLVYGPAGLSDDLVMAREG